MPNQVIYSNVVLKGLELKADGTIVTGRLNDYRLDDEGNKRCSLTTPIVIRDAALIEKLSKFIASSTEFEAFSITGEHNTRFDTTPNKENSERRKPWTQVVLKDIQVTKPE